MKRDEDRVFFFSLTLFTSFFLLVLLKEKFFIYGISMGIVRLRSTTHSGRDAGCRMHKDIKKRYLEEYKQKNITRSIFFCEKVFLQILFAILSVLSRWKEFSFFPVHDLVFRNAYSHLFGDQEPPSSETTLDRASLSPTTGRIFHF